MFSMPEKLTGISHPLVENIYAKKDLELDPAGTEDAPKTLVIETNFGQNEKVEDQELFDVYMVELLNDLNQLQNASEQKIGFVSHFDIHIK